jgi:hypothetical protein
MEMPVATTQLPMEIASRVDLEEVNLVVMVIVHEAAEDSIVVVVDLEVEVVDAGEVAKIMARVRQR